jgi:hypothetical protein
MWDRIALDEAEVRRGLAAGSLVRDVRLRNSFRRLRERGDVIATSPGRVEPGDVALGSAVFAEAEVVRLQRWLDEVHRRVTLVEERP